jgi:Prolyl-tRNA synthetase
MDAIGGQEMLMPVLTPAELWEATGRLGIPEIFHVTDRSGRHFILPVTHEETATFHAREISSYKQLPQLWYHFQTKDRDEPRPKGGPAPRPRVHHEGRVLVRPRRGRRKRSFEANREAYKKIFARIGIETYDVQAESGIMGGKYSEDFLAPCESGENVLVTCENGDYAADGDIAEAVPRAPEFPARLDAPEEIETTGRDDVRSARDVPGCGRRGDFEGDARDEAGRRGRAGARPRRRPAERDEALRRAAGRVTALDGRGDPGRLRRAGRLARPRRVRGRGDRRPDAAGRPVRRRRQPRGVALARRRGGPRLPAALRRPPRAEGGDRCPKCGGLLRFQTAVEVGHIFNFGSFYSGALQASFLDEDGQEKPLLGGSYGIGPARVMAAAVEQSNDENGIIWPKAIAPYDAHVVVLKGAEEIGEQAARVLSEAGLDVLLDDRDQRPGEKFADADLIGIPIRITAGKKSLEDGAVDVRDRASGEERRVSVDRLGKED